MVAAYLALAVHASFALRKRLGAAMWRRLHYLSFVALVGAGVHAVVAGTDSGILRPFYSVPLAIVGVLAAYRISARHGKRSRAARD